MFRLRTQSRGLVSVCAPCVRSAEETAKLKDQLWYLTFPHSEKGSPTSNMSLQALKAAYSTCGFK